MCVTNNTVKIVVSINSDDIMSTPNTLYKSVLAEHRLNGFDSAMELFADETGLRGEIAREYVQQLLIANKKCFLQHIGCTQEAELI